MRNPRYFIRPSFMALAMSLSLAVSAQTTDRKLCDFETSGACLSVGAYDTWEASPFRDYPCRPTCVS